MKLLVAPESTNTRAGRDDTRPSKRSSEGTAEPIPGDDVSERTHSDTHSEWLVQTSGCTRDERCRDKGKQDKGERAETRAVLELEARVTLLPETRSTETERVEGVVTGVVF